ncbi:MAG: mechanosensitive ion channel [Desulfofustis sp.]|nr:mechanosensitive ion channel [Desulfofustis sp.]
MLNRSKMRVVCTFLTIFIMVVCAPLTVKGEEQPAADTVATEEQNLDLIDAYKWSNLLPKELIDLQIDIESLADISNLEEEFADIGDLVEELEWDSVSLKSTPNLTFYAINTFEAKINKLNIRLNRINEPLQKNINELEAWHDRWAELEKKLQQISIRLDSEFESSDTFPEFYLLTDIINNGKKLINSHLRANLLAGHEIGKIQTRIYSLSVIGDELIREMTATGTQQTSPSMLSADFYRQVDRANIQTGLQNVKLFLKNQLTHGIQNLRFVAIGLLVILGLVIPISMSRKLVKPFSTWSSFANRPVATSLFVFCLGFISYTTVSTFVALPQDWETLIYLPLFLSVAVFSDNICSTRWQTILLRQLLLYIGLTVMLALVNLPQVLFYLFVFYASLGLIAYYLFYVLRQSDKSDGGRSIWVVLVWVIFPVLVIVAGVSGFDQLAVVLFGRILALIATTITIRLMLLFVSGLLELALDNAPWSFINNNAATIVRQVTPLLVLLHFILWIAFALVISWVYPTLFEAFAALFSLQFTIGSITVSPGAVINIILIVYVTLLVSRGFRAFLLQEVLPAHGVEKGVQLSISRLVHYAVLTIGFIFLLRVLGFGLNQITILGGALGVGIGFGLQAIVNNFVSGLILLFERPIKVGDMIDVGTQIGEVKELGLRATTVQTFDNAEVVIPNSQLISGNVTNWTLAEKKVRVRVPVGVAYGTDISTVFQILLGCAEANLRVLSSPKPAALFLAFGASSLDFELRAWIPDFDHRVEVLSELNQDIESEFQLAGIEIPFQQTDLHLRSVDQEAAEFLTGAQQRTAERPA